MTQSCLPLSAVSPSLQQLQAEKLELLRYLQAQKVVIASLERRVGRSLESLGVHVKQLTHALGDSVSWERYLTSVQSEVDCLCDLISDTLLLQKLEAGRVEVRLDCLNLHPLLMSVTRHLLDPKDGGLTRLICEIDPILPPALADQELTEAVLTDLLARGLRYSDPNLPVVLAADASHDQVCLRVTAQRFAPQGNRDFATEIALCCRRIEVQQGQITCNQRPDGLQTVTIALRIAPGAVDEGCCGSKALASGCHPSA
jgi:signal transduction histidine kinase